MLTIIYTRTRSKQKCKKPTCRKLVWYGKVSPFKTAFALSVKCVGGGYLYCTILHLGLQPTFRDWNVYVLRRWWCFCCCFSFFSALSRYASPIFVSLQPLCLSVCLSPSVSVFLSLCLSLSHCFSVCLSVSLFLSLVLFSLFLVLFCLSVSVCLSSLSLSVKALSIIPFNVNWQTGPGYKV